MTVQGGKKNIFSKLKENKTAMHNRRKDKNIEINTPL